jgi:hypothetical protein
MVSPSQMAIVQLPLSGQIGSALREIAGRLYEPTQA